MKEVIAMDMTTVKSLADHLVATGWAIPELSRHLEAAESGHILAVAVAVDHGITLNELCEGFRIAIRIKSQPA